jgi:multidrug resistance efflux pump
MKPTLRHLVWIAAAAAVVATAVILLPRLRSGGPSEPTPAGPTRPVSAPAAVVGAPRSRHELVLHGVVAAASQETIKSPVDGVVTVLAASQGNPVAEGQLLLQIKNAPLEARAREAEAALARTRAAVTRTKSDPDRKRLAEAQRLLGEVRDRAERAELELRRYRQENPQAVNALAWKQRAEENARRARAGYLAAKATFDKAQAAAKSGTQTNPAQSFTLRRQMETAKQTEDHYGTEVQSARKAADQSPNEIIRLQTMERTVADSHKRLPAMAAAVRSLAAREDRLLKATRQGKIAEAEARARSAQAAVARCQVTAPRAGALTALGVRPGQRVKAGQALGVIKLQGGSRLVFRASLEDLKTIQVGQDASVAAGTGPSFPARVSQVNRLAREGQVYVQPVGDVRLPSPETALVARLHSRG